MFETSESNIVKQIGQQHNQRTNKANPKLEEEKRNEFSSG